VSLARRRLALESTPHVRDRLATFEPARAARVVRLVELLPPPHHLSVEVSPSQAVTRACCAGLDVHDASFRTIAMPGVVLEAMEEHLARWTGPTADALVFTAPEGGPLRRDNFRTRVWYPATRAAALGGLRFHDLRHTAGTLAATTPGTTLRDVQTRLGHASIAAAVRYQHAALERDAAIAVHLDSLARGATA
jgi:hypothetical protein